MSMTIFAQCSVTHLYLFFIEKKQFACISANSRKIHNKMVDFSILEGKDPWEVGAIIGFGIADSTRMWMQQHGLLANRRSCLRCNSNMLMQNKSSVIDGKVWRCSNTVSIPVLISL